MLGEAAALPPIGGGFAGGGAARGEPARSRAAVAAASAGEGRGVRAGEGAAGTRPGYSARLPASGGRVPAGSREPGPPARTIAVRVRAL